METLLSLTSKRAGDWFKEEVRELRGLDHISDTGMLWRLHDQVRYEGHMTRYAMKVTWPGM